LEIILIRHAQATPHADRGLRSSPSFARGDARCAHGFSPLEPGDLIFQGGTSLHLVHGSPRYSEDLDFLVNSSLNLQSLAKAVEARLDGASWLVPAGAELTVSKAKDARNPHTFVVAIGGPGLIGAG
jgi:hypothetical protein